MRMPKHGLSKFSKPLDGSISFARRCHLLAPCPMSIGTRTTDKESSRTGSKQRWRATGRVGSRTAVFLIAWTYVAALAAWAGLAAFAPTILAGDPESAGVWTHNDYATAFRQAREEKKLLLVFFDDGSKSCRQFDDRTGEESLAACIEQVVGVRLALDASVIAQGQSVRLLDQKGFRGLEHGPGLEIIDLKHREAACYGWVVSVWKFGRDESISTADLAAMLELPPGNRQEREAAWAAQAKRLAEDQAKPAADDDRPTASSQSTAGTAHANKTSEATGHDGRPGATADPSGAPATPRQSGPEPSLLPAVEGRESKPQKAVVVSPQADVFVWHADYSKAVAQAKRDGKMLLIHFVDENDQRSRSLESVALQDADVGRLLNRYALLRLPHDATVPIDDKEVTLLKHEAFSEMLGRPGLAIVDYAHRNSAHYETVVSQFPLTETLSYSARQVAVMLDLPPGTLTQRTLIYAVRTHPERPASADGELLPELQREAESHSSYQARILRQGHHQWEVRFHRLNALLPRGLVAREVCAESWPGQSLVEAAIECVRCWRLSSGHWSAVRARQSAFGYDMKRGRNGVWYATGVFGGR